MLFFNTKKYNFWPIYDCTKKYYPLGIAKDDGTDMYVSFPGLKELIAIIVENIHEEKSFNERWTSFESMVQAEARKMVTGTTYGQAPSFSSFLELEKTEYNGLTRIKELFFFVSVAGPFYTVIGQDKSEVTMSSQIMRAVNFLVVSPEEDYAQPFHLLCKLIEERFKGFRFIPFGIGRQHLKGLEVHYRNEKVNSVFHALFDAQIDLNAQPYGDDYYKSGDWIVDGYVPGEGWTSYPPKT
jgi:hypothetical protein